MKILMILESGFPPDRRVENEFESLLQAGYKVDILCRQNTGQHMEESFLGGNIFRVPISKIIQKSSVAALSFPLYFNFWKSKINKFLTNRSYDVIHLHDLSLIKPVAELKSRYNFKIVLDLHENWPELLRISPHTQTSAGRLLCNIESWKIYEKKFSGFADRIIVVVEEAKERVAEFFKNRDNIYIVSNTINLKGIPQIQKNDYPPANKLRIIYEGGITYHRGLQVVLEALSKIPASGDKLEFRIVGSGSYLETLKNLVNKLSLESTVKFCGNVSQEKVFEILSTSDIAIIPHIKSPHTDSTIPHKLFHYINAGLPVISSDCDPIVRIINETGSGIIYRYDDPLSLSEILMKFVQDRSLVKKYSQAQKWITDKYNWEMDAVVLSNLYKSLENE